MNHYACPRVCKHTIIINIALYITIYVINVSAIAIWQTLCSSYIPASQTHITLLRGHKRNLPIKQNNNELDRVENRKIMRGRPVYRTVNALVAQPASQIKYVDNIDKRVYAGAARLHVHWTETRRGEHGHGQYQQESRINIVSGGNFVVLNIWTHSKG